MKLIVALAGLSSVAALAILELPTRTILASPGKTAASRAPVIVELFTSEGCSSCPPADTLLAKLFKEQPVDGAEIIALEEHVDYWDSLGWRDPFSSSKWTERQQEYSEVMRIGVYTPQMVVDGQTELVGSRAGESQKKISEESSRAKTPVMLSPSGASANGSQQYSVQVGKLAGGSNRDTAEVWVAIAEDNLQSSVTRGENAGEHLQHTSVLRTLRKIGVAEANKEESFSGIADAKLDPSWRRENTRIIVFVQERRSRKILGAAKAELSASTTSPQR